MSSMSSKGVGGGGVGPVGFRFLHWRQTETYSDWGVLVIGRVAIPIVILAGLTVILGAIFGAISFTSASMVSDGGFLGNLLLGGFLGATLFGSAALVVGLLWWFVLAVVKAIRIGSSEL